MLKKFKKAISIFQWLLTAVLVLAVLLLIFTAFNPIKTFQLFRVMSGSMEPKIKVGSVVFVQKVKPEVLKKDDIITYTSPENPEMSITHRLVEIEEKEGKTVFKTRGDANNSEDMAEVSPSEVKGRVVFSLPFLGYLSVWIKKPLGFGLLVILPALLIIVSEILSIKKAIEKEVEKKYAEKEKFKESKLTASLLIFFLLGISLLRIKPADAYFSDVLVIPGNTFSMASDWPTPEPPPPTARVVINEVEYDSVQTGVDSDYEWFELYNNTSSPITLSGWTITDNHSSDTIPDLTLPANGFAVVAAKESGFKTNYSGFSGLIVYVTDGEVGNGLANDGDRLVLKNNTGAEIDAVSWGTDKSAFTPSVPSVDAGHSISRKEKGVDTNTAADWMDTHIGSTPPGPNPGTNPHPPDLTEPTSTPSPTPEASPTSTPTVEPTPTPSPVPETSPTPTPTIEPSPTPEPTPTAEPTPTPSTTPAPSPSPEPSPTALPEPSASPSPTPIPSPQPSSGPEPTPSLTPTSSPTGELPTYEIA